MVPLSGSELTERRDAVALDVTTLIGADEYILARNNRVDPRDPFARQCFAELVQSILFMADIYVPHPTLTTPKPSDFGTRPVLLQQLMAADLLKPLTVSDQGGVTVAEAEELLLSELRRQGRESFRAFLAQVRDIDGMIGAVGARSSKSLAARLHSWCAFQRENVRIPESHGGRVPGDGIEADEFGLWARETSADFADELQWLAGDGEGPFIAATVARGLKYQARAEVAGLSYQPHPLRRDFLVNFTVRSAGADESYALGIAKVVRGVSEGFASRAGAGSPSRIRLYELALPFLGGRLWDKHEEGIYSDSEWVALVVERLRSYRFEMRHLRAAIGRCRTEDDYLRLSRDVEGVLSNALARVGIHTGRSGSAERELIDNVTSVAWTTVGFPQMSSLWLVTRSLLHRVRPPREKHVRFVYREIVQAWRDSGR